MEYPKHIDTISLGSPFCVLRGHRLKFLNYDEFMLLKIFFIQASSADPDECFMRHFIWVFTVCQSTCLSVSAMKKIINTFPDVCNMLKKNGVDPDQLAS